MEIIFLKKAVTFALVFMIVLNCSYEVVAKQEKNPKELIAEMENATGDWNKIYALKNVEFTYSYLYPEPNIKDLSTERYVFEGEKSWAKYTVHQINVSPKSEGDVIQYYDGEKASVSQKGKEVSDPAAVGLSQFLRKANYFWFVMNFKLSDPGTIHKYEGTESVNGIAYDKVSVAYESEKTGKPQNDAYILYINPETKMIDRFMFSLPAMGVNQPVLLMVVEYEDFNGVKLPTKRMVYQPDASGKYPEKPSMIQTSTNLKFNNQFSADDLKI